MIDPKKIFLAMINSAFPGASSANDPPTAGTSAANPKAAPSYSINAYADAASLAAIVAAGDANPVIPIEIIEIYSTADPVTYTPDSPPDPPGGGVAISATRRFRVGNIFGGIEWNYSDDGLYLVEREEKLNANRPLWVFRPEATPHVIETTMELEDVQDPYDPLEVGFYYSRMFGLNYIAGRWSSMLLFTPPRDDFAETATLAILMWDSGGALVATCYLDIYGEDAAPGMAHRRRDYGGFKHEIWWRSRRMGIYSEPWSGAIGDPFAAGRLAAVEDGVTLHTIDDLDTVDDPVQHLVISKPGGLIRWYDVEDWIEESAQMWGLKEFTAGDARGEIKDLAIDRTNRRLWVLLDDEIQRYDLDTFYPVGVTGDNDPRAIRAIDPPGQIQVGQEVTLTFQLRDMWGRSTSRTGAVVEFIAGADQGAFDVGGGEWEPRIQVASASGLVIVKYRNHLTTPSETPETIIGRIVATSGGL